MIAGISEELLPVPVTGPFNMPDLHSACGYPGITGPGAAGAPATGIFLKNW
jgi:hypothetical protein